MKLEDSFLWRFTDGRLDKPIIIDDIQKIANEFPEVVPPDYDLVIQSSLTTPITVNGELYALVNVDSCRKGIFDDYDLEMMTLLQTQIELVIRNE